MLLRPATMDDARNLFDWRTDPATIAASINAAPITWESHVSWLKATLDSPTRRLLIAERDSPVGTVRFDINDDGKEISWTVAPHARKQGIGRQMVWLATNGAANLYCHIKRDNIGSQRIAQQVGFTLAVDGELQRWVYRA